MSFITTLYLCHISRFTSQVFNRHWTCCNLLTVRGNDDKGTVASAWSRGSRDRDRDLCPVLLPGRLPVRFLHETLARR